MKSGRGEEHSVTRGVSETQRVAGYPVVEGIIDPIHPTPMYEELDLERAGFLTAVTGLCQNPTKAKKEKLSLSVHDQRWL